MSRMKQILKYFIVVLLYYSGLAFVFRFLKRLSRSNQKPLILMYHQVFDDPKAELKYSQAGLYVSTPVFDKQMSYLAKHYKPISLADLATSIRSNQTLDPKNIVITFDDGWRDNYQHAYPILKEYQLPAIIFLTANFIGTNDIFWFMRAATLMTINKLDRQQLRALFKKVCLSSAESDSAAIETMASDTDWFIEKLKKLDLIVINRVLDELSKSNKKSDNTGDNSRWTMNWDEVKEMSQHGISFGSHGCTHRVMTTLSSDENMRELRDSREVIEAKLGLRVDIFSYPNGDYNIEIEKLVEQGGYLCAVTTKGIGKPGNKSELFALRRIGVHEGISVGPRGNYSRAMFDFHLLRNS
ncbi:MAG TPA: hypothetical protein DEO84_08270 [candidate division Zixibacteria bacterium]|jgi:peptidoglycan/xylan/chitin deacetylase (PgdA/CDA1 family)|nr:hypothetical protein [candidate division Zixibacteria bacterium]HBZ01296.1 hypothetical protein [candidate division Zixibacteria bacterium]